MRAMVTGASDGIGGATCRLIAARARTAGQGARLVLTATGNRPPPQALISDLEREGAEVLFLTGDLSDADTARNLALRAEAFCGRLDLLVSNAGRVAPGTLAALPVQTWDAQFALNTRAAFVLAQTLRPALKAAQGAIVAVASMSGTYAHSRRAAYAPAKAALISLVRNLAQEWAADGIRVNAVSPGMIATPSSQPMYAHAALKAAREALVPLGRIGRPEDIAEAILYLGSPAASYVTGQNLVVDGGIGDSMLDRIPGLADFD